jgi:hypothetical protein
MGFPAPKRRQAGGRPSPDTRDAVGSTNRSGPIRAGADRSARCSPGSSPALRSSVFFCAGAGITIEVCSAQAGSAALIQALGHALAERIDWRRRHPRRRRALRRRSVDDGPRRHRLWRRNPDLHIGNPRRHLRRRGSTSDCAARRQDDGKKIFHDRAPCYALATHHLVIRRDTSNSTQCRNSQQRTTRMIKPVLPAAFESNLS